MDDHGKNCHLTFENDKNWLTFDLPCSFGSATSSSGFLLNWTKIIQIFQNVYLLTTFLLLDELFLVVKQVRLTDFLSVN